jgi:signal transduction histidine kinase
VTCRNTALGLTITQGFARLMGGDVTVKIAEGKGSTFTLSVPAGIAAPMQIAA